MEWFAEQQTCTTREKDAFDRSLSDAHVSASDTVAYLHHGAAAKDWNCSGCRKILIEWRYHALASQCTQPQPSTASTQWQRSDEVPDSHQAGQHESVHVCSVCMRIKTNRY
jgi:hypothetical protein